MNCDEVLYWYQWFQVLLFFSTIYIAVDVFSRLKKRWEKHKLEKMFAEFEPDPLTLTCYSCDSREYCRYVDDAYNTNGDCLADK
jgi:hypothetical protein